MFKKILRDLLKGENITVLATILLVIITIVAKGLGLVPDALVATLTLAMLGLIATGFLTMKYQNEEILKTSKVKDPADTVQLLSEFPDQLDELLKTASEIWMLGITLRKTTHNHYDDFVVRLQKGLKIRALLLNPYSRSVNLTSVARSYSRKDSPELFAAEYRTVLLRYEALLHEANQASDVQVGLLDFVPPFSLYIFPHAKEGGIIFVQLYAYKAPVGATPYFVVTQKDNPIWYGNFCALYEQMWDDSLDYFSDFTANPVMLPAIANLN